MSKIKKIILGILGIGVASAAGFDAITPADTTMSKVTAAYKQSAPLKEKYALDNSRFIKRDGDKNHVKTEIGEAGKAEFEPSLTISRWNGEASIKIKPDISKVAKKNKKIELDGEKIKYKAGKQDYVFYDKPDASDEGGFEFEIVLNEKSNTNTWSEAIESTGVEFYKQLPLNEEQQEAGVTCTATECRDATGNVVSSRPEDIVDSIAVYGGKSGDFTALGGMNYMAGKVAHIKRVKAIDANSNWTWCDQDIANGVWTKNCPQYFLDNAVYPVVVDPTFGYTTAGKSYDWSGGEKYVMRQYESYTGAAGTATSMSAYQRSGGSPDSYIQMGIYETDGDLVGSTESVLVDDNSSSNWHSANFASPPTVQAVGYYLAQMTDDNWNNHFYYDSGASGNLQYYQASSFGTWANPASWSSMGSYAYIPSIYATYTAGGSSEETQGTLIE